MDDALAATALGPGRELANGKYRLVRLLGAGGMGSVFEAEHMRTRKRVAIKCMNPAHARNPEAAERFVREAEAAGRVRHPNVVDVYDVGRDHDVVYLVMEYLEGEPLSKLMTRGDLPIYRIIALLLPAMRAVAAAHKRGVIHRDIKPDNIFLATEADAPQPVAKVLDFGIAKLESTDPDQLSLTRSGSTIGTPRYMAYEQLTGSRDIDERVDVYAFGVILYEALTGRLPYDADTFPELIIKVTTTSPAAPKELRSEIPRPLDRLVCWAMAKEREERISSLDVLIRELEPFATEFGFRAEMTLADAAMPSIAKVEARASRTPDHARAAPVPVKLEASPHRWRYVVIGLAGAGVVAFTAMKLLTSRDGAAALTRSAPATQTQAAPAQPAAAASLEPTVTATSIVRDADRSFTRPPEAGAASHAEKPHSTEAANPIRRKRTRMANALSEPPANIDTQRVAAQPQPTGATRNTETSVRGSASPPAAASERAAPFRVRVPLSKDFY